MANQRYGGNTACVVLEAPGADPIVLDLGTGLRFWGETLAGDAPFRGSALVTHLHWDHVQGLPFFAPLHRPGARFDIYGPAQPGLGMAAAFDTFMGPPYFPVGIAQLGGDVSFHDVADTDLVIGDAKVQVRNVPHIGLTNGYRIEAEGVTVAYLSDHQQPLDGGMGIAESVRELCDGVDLLIHDAQYTPAEFTEKAHWGHCTIDYAVNVAKQSGARRLALFHHDPTHDDATLDRLLAHARELASGSAVEEVLCASEGLTVSLSARAEVAQ